MAKGRARRSRRSSRRKSGASRWLVIGGIVLALGYFVFTRFFFDPFEAAQPRYDLLVPRDVDMFVRRERLDLDFDPFPTPALLKDLQVDQSWRTLTSGEWWSSLEWPADAKAFADDLRTQLEGSPLDPESLLAGEVALAGRHMATSGRYALLVRLTGGGKLAVESLALDRVFQEFMPGATREERDHPVVADLSYWQVQPDGADELFFARASDTLVVGQDEQLMVDVLETMHRDPEQSLGLSRLWNDHLPRASATPESGPSFEVAVNAEQVLRGLEWLPDLEEPDRDALADIWPRVIDLSLLQQLVGRVELLDGRISVAAHSELDVGSAQHDRGGLVGQAGVSAGDSLRDRLGLLPSDVAACLDLHVDMRRFLTVLHQGLGEDARQLLDGTLRDVSKWSQDQKILDVASLVTQVARLVGDRLTVAVRPRLTPVDEGLQPLPELAFIMPLDDLAGWQQLEDFFLRGHGELGLSNDSMFQLDEGVGVRKWASVPGLSFSEVSWMVLDKQTLVLSTSQDLLANIVQVYSLRRESAAAQDLTRELLDDLKARNAQGNAVAWVDAEALGDLLEPYGRYVADLDTLLDFGVLRAQREREVLGRDYGGRGRADLSDDEAAALDAQLDSLLTEQERVRKEQTVPTLAREWTDGFSWLGILRQGVFALRMGERSADLHVQLSTSLEK